MICQTHPVGESRSKKPESLIQGGGDAEQVQVVNALGGRMHVRRDAGQRSLTLTLSGRFWTRAVGALTDKTRRGMDRCHTDLAFTRPWPASHQLLLGPHLGSGLATTLHLLRPSTLVAPRVVR